MLKKLGRSLQHYLSRRVFPFLVVHIGQKVLRILLWTCRTKIEGLEDFKKTARNEKCLLMLWHNRLALAPSIILGYAPEFTYAAFVSKSRDGELISSIIESYPNGRIIRVPHNARHHALRILIKHLQENKDVIAITPDGPRGPAYEMKQGAVLAALETSAHVVSLNWTADKYWEFNTWDKLRIPKPFSTVTIRFGKAVVLDPSLSREQARSILQESMMQ